MKTFNQFNEDAKQINAFMKNALMNNDTVKSIINPLKDGNINITDINVNKALTNHSIYLAAKSGLQTITQSLAKELAPDIRVNAIAPGAILEPPNTTWTKEQKDNIIKLIPMSRMGNEKDIADAAIYLSEAEYVTGQILNVDGGKSL